MYVYRYPELLKPPDSMDSLYSDRNSSYDNVEKRDNTLESTIRDRTYNPSEWETMQDTDDSDCERVKRNKSFKERLDPLLCEFALFIIIEKFLFPWETRQRNDEIYAI